jgi:hypothetical protein
MKFQSIKTSKLSKKEINQIISLKDSHWKFGRKSQISWFKKRVLANDVHNLMIINGKIIGYTFLGIRSFRKYKSKHDIKEMKYTLFSTLILKKKFRNLYYVSKMMKFNNKIILKLKKPSFLICKMNKVNLYKFYKWQKLRKKIYSIPDHKTNFDGMVFNFNKKDKYRYLFYFNP